MPLPERPIDPPRASPIGGAIIAAALILLTYSSFASRVSPWCAALSLVLIVIALLAREIQALHLALFTSALIGLPAFVPALRTWPYSLLIPIGIYGIIVLAVSRMRASVHWMRIGRMTGKTILFAIAVSAVSMLALYSWYRILSPDLTAHLSHFPAMPLWMVPLAGLGFSIGNAALEEAAFRGIIMQACDSAWGPGKFALLMQAWLFGVMHYLQGFPNGWWGLGMTFVYGVMLGGLRRRSRGMLAPWLAHVIADMVIFGIVAGVALGAGM